MQRARRLKEQPCREEEEEEEVEMRVWRQEPQSLSLTQSQESLEHSSYGQQPVAPQLSLKPLVYEASSYY